LRNFKFKISIKKYKLKIDFFFELWYNFEKDNISLNNWSDFIKISSIIEQFLF